MSIQGDKQRNKDLAMIHIGAQTLGMDTKDQDPSSEYRSMLWTCGRVSSSKDLDYFGRKKVLEHLKARGFNNHAKPNVPPEKKRYINKIGAQLADMKLSWRYANGIAKQMFGIEKASWCDIQQLLAIIAALANKQAKQNAKAAS